MSGPADAAIVGFGFSGLAALLAIRERDPQAQITVIAPDARGLGLAYGTEDPHHLLNVPAEKMGASASAPYGFADWLASPDGASAAAGLGLPVPAPDDFAPRMLFGAYLSSLCDARDIQHVAASAQSITRAGDLWDVDGHRARAVVLATGNEIRARFGRPGPWGLRRAELSGEGPVVLVGSGLTAVDTLLSVRRLGYTGEIIALSRSGRLPAAHHPEVEPLAIDVAALDGLDSVVALIRDTRPDWRAAMDGLRPHTHAIWQRFGAADQTAAVEEWSSQWSALRHRMAPRIAAQIHAERTAGSFTVTPLVPGADVTQVAAALSPRLVIDCTGPELDPRRSAQPLLRGLVASGVGKTHHTGLGFCADGNHQIAPGLYAMGGLLSGQLWESVAVPELRDEAAVIAAHLTRTWPGRTSRPGARHR